MGQANSEMIGNWKVMDEKSFNRDWEVIGAGGFGQVFKARHRQWKKDVAIKLIGLDDGSIKEDLVREANLMLSADSPHTLKVLGVFRGCSPYNPSIQVGLVMELMESGSLYSLQKKRERQPLPWPLVFRLVHQVSLGMNYLHGLTPALIHKDLKPDNILLDSDLNVKITDFGLAKFANTVTNKPLQGKCTAFYAPPEAFLAPEEAPKGGATCAYDVYSFAVLAWTILNPVYNDTQPFDVSRGVTSLKEVKSMEVPGLEELVELMERCWNQDPDQRPTFAECTAVTQRLHERHGDEINDTVHTVQLKLDFAVIRKFPKKDFQRLTLDPNTACDILSLSENNRKVTGDGFWESSNSYTDHCDRFDEWAQVLCTESLTGRCYWEVEWRGKVDIAVTYRGISKKGGARDGLFGANDKSWSLDCGNSYSVVHNCQTTDLPVRPSKVGWGSAYRGRVAVYVDHPAGTLSFYEVSADSLRRLYTFQSTFTEPLYAGFWLRAYSSVCLCEQI